MQRCVQKTPKVCLALNLFAWMSGKKCRGRRQEEENRSFSQQDGGETSMEIGYDNKITMTIRI